MMTSEVSSWWFLLCTISVLNVAGWLVSARVLGQRRGWLSAEAYATRRLQLLLSAGYVLGCAFRSFMPVYDVQRMVIVDSWLSSVVVGRSVATVAELCFVAQWALMLREISRATGSTVGRTVSFVVVPLITIAEACSWYSVLTTSNIGHVVEESIWGLSAALMVVSLAAIWPVCDAAVRRLLAVWCTMGLAYVGFMFLVDVPMYWSRWLADEASGRAYFDLAQGLADVSHRWVDWQSEVVWMSLYFSVAVWMSLALVHAPVLVRREPAGARQQGWITLQRLPRRAPG